MEKGIGIYLSHLTEICIFGFRTFPVVRLPQILRTHFQRLITGYKISQSQQLSSGVIMKIHTPRRYIQWNLEE